MAFPPCHSFMFQTHEDPDLHLSAASSSLNNLPSCPPQHFHGGGGGIPFMMRRSLSFSGVDDKCNHHHYDHQDLHGGGDQDDLSDDGSQLIGEKKKRLNLEQVKTLEKSFEMGNKLEPERKLQLAKALGLQPRQVAIWFQNRRARWKTKQLEKDYDVLKKKFDALKADNDALQSHNKKLQSELLAIKGSKDSNFEGGLSNNMKKETDQGSWSNGSTDDNSSDHINLDMSRSNTPAATSPQSNTQITNGSKNLFPSSLCRPPHASITQLLQGSSRSSDLHCLKVDQMIQDDQTFCTMFNNGSIDQDHQGNFWPWPAEQPHHFH
ncbi:hypothetical protein ACLB2K_067886 [Fragaria x ananassa]